MRFCIKFIVILVILATCLEVNQAKRGGGSRGSSSRSSSSSSRSSSSRSSSSSSRSSSSSSRRGSSSGIGTKIRNVATKIKNAVKPKKTPSVSSSSSSSSSFGSSSSGSKNPFSSSSSSSQPKKKSKIKKRLKQAALIGAGAYVGYKLGKLKEKFSNRKWGGGSSSTHITIGGSSSSSIRRPRYQFNDWNNWREADGFLCRSNDDCKWVDNNLNCEDYEFDFTPAAGWFGGDTVTIRGECNCEPGYIWNENQLSCDLRRIGGQRINVNGGQQINGSLAIGAIIGIVIACLIGFCCCCGICCLIGKTFLSS